VKDDARQDFTERIKEASDFIAKRLPATPDVAIVAGSGLGEHLSSLLEISSRVPYADIPGFPTSTVAGHSGYLVAGQIAQHPVLLFSGRKHFYEGKALKEVIFPAVVLHQLKIPRLILTNAAGGLNTEFSVGDLMLITEGINLIFQPYTFGELYPPAHVHRLDFSTIFSPLWRKSILELLHRKSMFIRTGVYVAVSGPSYETPAEVAFLRLLGADAVGMSTVPEAAMAASLGIEVIAVSFITNLLAEMPLKKTGHEEVLEASRQAGPRLAHFIQIIIEDL